MKEAAFPKKILSLDSTAWAKFSKLLVKPTKYRRLHYPRLNLRLNLQKQKTKSSVSVTRKKLSNWTEKCDYRSGLKRTRLASFPSKCLNFTLINSFLQKLSTWVNAKSNTSTRINFLLRTSVTFLRALRIKTKKENNSLPITVTRTKKKLYKVQIWSKRMHFLLADDLSNIHFSNPFVHFQSTSNR